MVPKPRYNSLFFPPSFDARLSQLLQLLSFQPDCDNKNKTFQHTLCPPLLPPFLPLQQGRANTWNVPIQNLECAHSEPGKCIPNSPQRRKGCDEALAPFLVLVIDGVWGKIGFWG